MKKNNSGDDDDDDHNDDDNDDGVYLWREADLSDWYKAEVFM